MAADDTTQQTNPNGLTTPSNTTGGLFSGLTSLVGGQLLGPSLTNPNFGNAVGTLQQAQNQINMNPTPTTAQMQLLVQNYVQQGILTPAQAQAIQQNPNALQQIMTNPALTNSQMTALSQLNQIATGGGITPAMQAQLNDIQQKNAATARGQNAATMQQAQERGMGNSGTQLLSNLVNNQGEAANNYNEGLGVAAQGQNNALTALNSGANLAGNMQATQFGQQAQVDAATNAINQFNANNAQNVNLTNTAAQNTAEASNLANKQNTANLSTQAQNTAAAYNATLPQQQFADNSQTAALNAGAAKNTAAAQQQLGSAQNATSNATQNSIASLLGNPNTKGSISNTVGSGADSAFSGFGDAISSVGSDLGDFFSDENLKKNVKKDDFDMEKFLNSLSNYKYDYKPKAQQMGMPSGTQHGVMAQDLQKTPVGKNLVNDTPDGKMVDYKKSGPVMMAALAHLHGRVKNLEGNK